MNYQRIYNALVYRGQNRINEKGIYIEKHHVIPRCMGGTDDKSNIVSLTGREHFIAHLLLSKIHPNNPKIMLAVKAMCMDKNGNRAGNRMYSILKERCAKASSLLQKGRKTYREPHNKGKKNSPEHIAKVAAALSGMKHTPEAVLKRSQSNKAKNHKRTDEQRKRISDGASNRISPPWSEERRAKVAATWERKLKPAATANDSETPPSG